MYVYLVHEIPFEVSGSWSSDLEADFEADNLTLDSRWKTSTLVCIVQLINETSLERRFVIYQKARNCDAYMNLR